MVVDTLHETLPKYAQHNWKYRIDTGILREYLLFQLYEQEKPVAELSIYYGNDKLKDGQLQVGNIVPLSKNSLSKDEYNQILLRFYKDIVIPYKQENKVPYITEPSTDKYDLHQEMSDRAYDALVRFLNIADTNIEDDLMDSMEEEVWHSFVFETFSDNRELGAEDLLFAFLDEDFHTKIRRGTIKKERAALLAHRYEIEYAMLKYYEKHVSNSIKWEII